MNKVFENNDIIFDLGTLLDKRSQIESEKFFNEVLE